MPQEFKNMPVMTFMETKAETLCYHFLVTAEELLIKITEKYVDGFKDNKKFLNYLNKTYDADYSELNCDELLSVLIYFADTDELVNSIEAFFLCFDHAKNVFNYFCNFYIDEDKDLDIEEESINHGEEIDEFGDQLETKFVELFGDLLIGIIKNKFGGHKC